MIHYLTKKETTTILEIDKLARSLGTGLGIRSMKATGREVVEPRSEMKVHSREISLVEKMTKAMLF